LDFISLSYVPNQQYGFVKEQKHGLQVEDCPLHGFPVLMFLNPFCMHKPEPFLQDLIPAQLALDLSKPSHLPSGHLGPPFPEVITSGSPALVHPPHPPNPPVMFLASLGHNPFFMATFLGHQTHLYLFSMVALVTGSLKVQAALHPALLLIDGLLHGLV